MPGFSPIGDAPIGDSAEAVATGGSPTGNAYGAGGGGGGSVEAPTTAERLRPTWARNAPSPSRSHSAYSGFRK